MEKNWIKEVRDFLNKAMNKGLKTEAYHYHNTDTEYYKFHIYNDKYGYIRLEFAENPGKVYINTPRGNTSYDINLSKRDLLELDAVVLSVEEYCEDMAIYEFEHFFSEDDSNKVTDINDLDNDDE